MCLRWLKGSTEFNFRRKAVCLSLQLLVIAISVENIFFSSICMEWSVFLFNNLHSNLVSFFIHFLAASTLLRYLLEVTTWVWASLAYLPVFWLKAEMCYDLLQDINKANLYKRKLCSIPPFEISLQCFAIKTANLRDCHLLFWFHQPIISLRMHLISKGTSSRHCFLPLCSSNYTLGHTYFCLPFCMFISFNVFCYSFLYRNVLFLILFQQLSCCTLSAFKKVRY